MTRRIFQPAILMLIIFWMTVFVLVPATAQNASGYSPIWIPGTNLIAFMDGYTLNIYDASLDLKLVSTHAMYDKKRVDVNRYGAVWSPDGSKVAIYGDVMSLDADTGEGSINTLQIWQRDPWLKLAEITGTVGGDAHITWNPSGELLAASASIGYYVEAVFIYRASDGTLQKILAKNIDDGFRTVEQLRWSPAEPRLAVVINGSNDSELYVWDIQTDRPVQRIPLTLYPEATIAYNRDGTQIAFIDRAHPEAIAIWDLNSLQPALTLTGHTREVWDFSWSGDTLISIGLDNVVNAWDTRTGHLRWTLSNDMAGLDFNPDGTQFVIRGSSDARDPMQIFDAATGAVMAER